MQKLTLQPWECLNQTNSSVDLAITECSMETNLSIVTPSPSTQHNEGH